MADTLKDDLLPLIDELRGLPGELGFRPYQVWVRTVEWSGHRAGNGVSKVTDARLSVGNGQDPKVKKVHRNDVVGGKLESVDAVYDIGPLTPKYSGGGVANEVLNPSPTADNQAVEVFYLIKGDGMPADGLLCKRLGDDNDRALRRMVRVASIGVDAANLTD